MSPGLFSMRWRARLAAGLLCAVVALAIRELSFLLALPAAAEPTAPSVESELLRFKDECYGEDSRAAWVLAVEPYKSGR